MGTPILSAEHLSFGYGTKKVLDNIHFTLEAGDFVGLVGSNGSGKTTLIRLLLGLLSPDSGQIVRPVLPSTGKPAVLGYVSQKAATFNSGFPATVEEVVMANLYSSIGCCRRPRAAHRARVSEALERVGLLAEAKRPIAELSGGQQQRVFIARTLVAGVDVMFLDEPTVGVDMKAEQDIYTLLTDLNRTAGLTLVLVSHDIAAVTARVNRLFCIGADGFFEHCLSAGCREDFYRQLYGYDVVPHIHHHPLPSDARADEGGSHVV